MLRAALRASRRVQGVALQQQRSFAEKAVAAEVDWDAIGEMVQTDEGKRELAALRATYVDVRDKLDSMAKDLPPIDWASWRKRVDPELVDLFKKAFETMQIPDIPDDKLKAADAQFDALFKQAEALEAASAKRVVELQKELDDIEKEKERVATITVDEELAADPKLAAEIDAEIASKHFMP